MGLITPVFPVGAANQTTSQPSNLGAKGRKTNLEYGSNAPDAPSVFIHDAAASFY
jgi:hypothetical protein